MKVVILCLVGCLLPWSASAIVDPRSWLKIEFAPEDIQLSADVDRFCNFSWWPLEQFVIAYRIDATSTQAPAGPHKTRTVNGHSTYLTLGPSTLFERDEYGCYQVPEHHRAPGARYFLKLGAREFGTLEVVAPQAPPPLDAIRLEVWRARNWLDAEMVIAATNPRRGYQWRITDEAGHEVLTRLGGTLTLRAGWGGKLPTNRPLKVTVTARDEWLRSPAPVERSVLLRSDLSVLCSSIGFWPRVGLLAFVGLYFGVLFWLLYRRWGRRSPPPASDATPRSAEVVPPIIEPR